jgi:DNA-binding TFAR19-related protein (PDSD5 family)
MSDPELERLRRRKLAELSKRFLKNDKKENEEDKKQILHKVFVGRAWEVFNATRIQYPQVAEKLSKVLVHLASSGKITTVNGEELYFLLRRLGLRVRLQTTIRFKEHGKLKSIEQKLKQ